MNNGALLSNKLTLLSYVADEMLLELTRANFSLSDRKSPYKPTTAPDTQMHPLFEILETTPRKRIL